jgi:hypothetical protein
MVRIFRQEGKKIVPPQDLEYRDFFLVVVPKKKGVNMGIKKGFREGEDQDDDAQVCFSQTDGCSWGSWVKFKNGIQDYDEGRWWFLEGKDSEIPKELVNLK